jgi:hypothetical protein
MGKEQPVPSPDLPSELTEPLWTAIATRKSTVISPSAATLRLHRNQPLERLDDLQQMVGREATRPPRLTMTMIASSSLMCPTVVDRGSVARASPIAPRATPTEAT